MRLKTDSALKKYVFQRDLFTCQYCGHKGLLPFNLWDSAIEYHGLPREVRQNILICYSHAIPNHEGDDDTDNFSTTCLFCLNDIHNKPLTFALRNSLIRNIRKPQFFIFEGESLVPVAPLWREVYSELYIANWLQG